MIMKVNNDKVQLVSFKDHFAEMMRIPKYKKAYDDLEFEFSLIKGIIDARIKKGITYKKLARKMGVKQSAIINFMINPDNSRLVFLIKLSRALNVKLSVTH